MTSFPRRYDRSRILRLVPAAALVAAAACSSKKPAQTANADVTWDTLPNHAVHATYGGLPVIPLTTAADLKIGGAGAQGPAAFADVRGVDADSTGRIYVFDAQADELRAFDAKGAPAGVVEKKGEGPSEIQGGNGFMIDAAGAIWVNDARQGLVTRLKDGEFKTYPMPVPGFGNVWQGGVTRDGQIWDFWAHPADGAKPPQAAQPGPVTLTTTLFLKKLDTKSGSLDSAAVATQTTTSLSFGNAVLPIPFTARRLVAVDPAGAVWTAMSEQDRVVKVSGKGDTLLVIDMPGAGPDVNPDERAKAVAQAEKFIAGLPKRGAAAPAPDWDKLIPKRKPVLMGLSVDDKSRLWIERATLSRGPMFDILSPDGQLLGTIDPDFNPAENTPITIRGKSIYAVLKDSLDVPTVVRAPVTLR